ncbi:MAG TPA: Rieske 2Fe-2S domain-containing protein [Gammaproteobacteria bacterium]|nr:Rieske 2Fe-2S domain-containing protein [Gammaproteobacteria bacterium]
MPHTRRHSICRLTELPDQSARGFSFPGARFPDEYFVVRQGDAVHGYRNQCPHAGNFLNWKPDAFLTRDRTLIMCSAHGALFEPGTGNCVAGPCVGRNLDAVRVAVEQDEVVAYLEPETA